VQAREINSHEDEVRLSGYHDYLKDNKQAEKARISDVHEIAKAKLKELALQEVALKEYKKEKAKIPPALDENSPEWKDYVKEKLSIYSLKEQDRKTFILEKKSKQNREHKIIDLSEEQELTIADNSPRVDWNKRRFSDSAGSGGRSGFDSGSPTFTPPPVYSNPSYFDNPPPPPPPPSFEPFDDGQYPPPPPPPPPMFEDESPF
jgi:hypothetical protein